jgi:hypothetical protein
VIAARLLGPSGLGKSFVGFTVCLLALSLQRALISDPLVVMSAALPPDERRRATMPRPPRLWPWPLSAMILVIAIGFALPGSLGRGLLKFAPGSLR